ncbi:antibiotic biosynthesis monooxygenase [Burkholderia multivorans]|nr:antibiotic biosynthesis monooxygenase [Burkholderia multivorans]
MFVVVVDFFVQPSFAKQFEEVVLKNASDSRELEPECVVFDVCTSSQEGHFYLYEVYTSEAAFGEHLQAEHFLKFSELTASWVDKKDVKTYKLLGNAERAEQSRIDAARQAPSVA